MKNLLKISMFFLLLGIFVFGAKLTLATTCPDNTQVLSETSANLVGEVTDDGGDPNLTVWLQYGKTVSYGYETSHQSQNGAGKFCAVVSNLEPCTTYHYRAVAQNSAGTGYAEDKTFTTQCLPVSVDIKANNSNGPITISYNSSATLSWTSANANNCQASENWSGLKTLSGSESTGNLTSSRSYALTCTGLGGSSSDRVTINVSAAPASVPTLTQILIEKSGRNLSDGTSWSKSSVAADPNELVEFAISVTAQNGSLTGIIVQDSLPVGLIYRNKLEIDNFSAVGDITTGLNIGNLSSGRNRVITFRAQVAAPNQFAFGQTELVNRAIASSGNVSNTDSATVLVKRTAIAAAATRVSTGLTNNLLIDSFVLPLAIALSSVWLFRSQILGIEEWLDRRRKQVRAYRTRKLLQFKVSQIKAQERF